MSWSLFECLLKRFMIWQRVSSFVMQMGFTLSKDGGVSVKLLPMLLARSHHFEMASICVFLVQEENPERKSGNPARPYQILKLRPSTDRFSSYLRMCGITTSYPDLSSATIEFPKD